MVFSLLRLYPAATDVKLKLPVRVISQDVYIKNLAPGDFQLLINDQPRSLSGVYPRSRSIAAAKPGRCFALSFDITSFNPGVVSVVTRFVHDTLSDGDQLVFRSPMNIYRIDVSAAKEDIIAYIKSQLEKDSRQYKKERDENLAQMVMLIENLGPKLEKKKAGIRWVSLFTGHIATQWNNFYANFMVHHLEQFLELTQQMAQCKGEGREKWLIHFQGYDGSSDLAAVTVQFRQLHQLITAFLDELPANLGPQVSVIRESLGKVLMSMNRGTGSVPVELLDALLGVNVGVNVVFQTPKEVDGKPEHHLSTGFRLLLEEMARKTGGLSLEASDPVKALETIYSHEDFYYDLIYSFDGKAVDKSAAVRALNTPTGTMVFHKTTFMKEEFTWLMAYLDHKTDALAVADFSLKDRALSFTVSGYKQQSGGTGLPNSGMVQISIRLIDDAQETVYETGNTLKSADTSVSVSLRIPEKHKGYFKLSIIARDMLSGQTAELKKYVKLL